MHYDGAVHTSFGEESVEAMVVVFLLALFGKVSIGLEKLLG